MIGKLHFIIFNIVFPIVLSVIFSKNFERHQLSYSVTKGTWYLMYAFVVVYDYIINDMTKYVAGFTVTLAIMEGLPLILTPLFKKSDKK